MDAFTLRDGSAFAIGTHPCLPQSAVEIANHAAALVGLLDIPLPPAIELFSNPAVQDVLGHIGAHLPASLLLELRDSRGRALVASALAATGISSEQ